MNNKSWLTSIGIIIYIILSLIDRFFCNIPDYIYIPVSIIAIIICIIGFIKDRKNR